MLRGLLGALIGGALAGVALVVTALARGPVDLPMLRAPVAQLIEGGFDGAQARIGAVGARLFRDGRLAPELVVRDAVILDAVGRRLFSAAEMRVRADPRALLGGRARPSFVAISGAAVTVRRALDGGVSIALGGAAASAAPAGGAGFAPDFDGRLELSDARLSLIDEAHAMRMELSGGDVSARLEGGVVAARFSADLAQGGDPAARLTGRMSLQADGSGAATAALRGARTNRAAQLLRELTPLADLDALVDLELETRLGPGGALEQAKLSAHGSQGALRLEGAHLAFDTARILLDYDRARDRIAITDAALSGPLGRARFSGHLDMLRDLGGEVSGASVELLSDGFSITAPALFPETAAFDSAHLVARLRRDRARIELAGATLRRGALSLRARGAFAADARGWGGTVDLLGRGALAADVRDLWPIGVAPGARDWVRANLEQGRAPRFDLTARFGPEQEGVALSFVFADGRAQYLPPMPPLARAAGWGVVDMRRFGLGLSEGGVAPEGAGAVSLAGSSIVLPDIDDPQARSRLALRGVGALDGFLTALDSEPLGFVRRVGLDPRAVSGRATARAALDLPLLKDLRLEQIAVETEARLGDVALSLPSLGREVAAEALDLEADAARLRVAGAITLDGAPMQIDATEVFAPAPGEMRRGAVARMRLTPARAKAFGLDLSDRFEGAAALSAEFAELEGGAEQMDLRLDLGDAALSVDELGWRKDAGVAGSLIVDARREGSGAVRLRSFDLDTPSLRARGAARLGPAGDLRALSLSRFRLRDQADLTLELIRDGAGWRIGLDGAHLDAGLLRRLSDLAEKDAGGAKGRTPLQIDAALRRLRLSRGAALVGVRAEGALDAAGHGQAMARGRLGAASVSARYVAQPGAAPRVTADTDDLGALLRALDLYPDAYGGAFGLTARMGADAGAPVLGEAIGGGLRIARESGLAARVAEAAPEEAARLLREEGLRIDRAQLGFELTPEALTLRDGRANGPSVGLTLEGRYAREAGTVALSGVFTPAYGVNSAPGAVPVLGGLLTGGEGQGVFAFNYRIEGPVADPKLVFNPLSGLAPGVLRKLFQP